MTAARKDVAERATDREQAEAPSRQRRPWTTPHLRCHGPLHPLLAAGSSKLSANFDGDGRKPPGFG